MVEYSRLEFTKKQQRELIVDIENSEQYHKINPSIPIPLRPIFVIWSWKVRFGVNPDSKPFT